MPLNICKPRVGIASCLTCRTVRGSRDLSICRLGNRGRYKWSGLWACDVDRMWSAMPTVLFFGLVVPGKMMVPFRKEKDHRSD